MSMLGSRSSSDSGLARLIDLASDPAKFKSAIAELKEATAAHRKARELAVAAKKDADFAIAKAKDQVAVIAQREAAVKAAEGQIAVAKAAVQADRANLDKRVAGFEAGIDSALKHHNDKMTAGHKQLADRETVLEQREHAINNSALKAEAAANKRKSELEALATALAKQQSEIDNRADAVTKLELEVRSRIRKINDLFPVN